LTSVASSKKPIISAEKIKGIFSIIEVIYNYNSILLDSLETKMKRWVLDSLTTPLIIGDIFVKMTDYMHCYSTYINNYNTAMATLAEAKKTNPGFAAFLKKAESDPVCRMQDLEAFIINPIQQLPRYIMLLSDLSRSTPKDHPDFNNITLALEKMKNLTTFVNEQKREAESVQAIVSVQQRVRGKFPTLLTPHRKFIKEGAVGYDNGTLKEKEGYVFLFNDLLVLAKPTNKASEYKFKEQIVVKGLKMQDNKDDQKIKNAFVLEGVKSWVLCAKTLADKTLWMSTIKPLL